MFASKYPCESSVCDALTGGPGGAGTEWNASNAVKAGVEVVVEVVVDVDVDVELVDTEDVAR